MDNNNVQIKQMQQVPYDWKKPSEIYISISREPDPMGPPDAHQIKTGVDFQNFANPLEVLTALELAKATIINLMMQQQMVEAQKNPNFKKPPWARN